MRAGRWQEHLGSGRYLMYTRSHSHIPLQGMCLDPFLYDEETEAQRGSDSLRQQLQCGTKTFKSGLLHPFSPFPIQASKVSRLAFTLRSVTPLPSAYNAMRRIQAR